MTILLKILMYTGLTLLFVLLFLLVLLLLVLFLPIRYRGKLDYSDSDGLEAYVKASFLFHMLSFQYLYKENGVASFKLFGINLLNKKKKQKKRKHKEKTLDFDNDDESSIEEVADNNDLKSDNLTSEKVVCKESVINESIYNKSVSEDTLNKGISNSETAIEEITKEKTVTEEAVTEETVNKDIADSLKDIDDKKSKVSKENKDNKDNIENKNESDVSKTSIYDKIKRYIELIKSDLFKRAFARAKEKLVKILKNILPRKWEINAVAGFDDPATTGSLLAISGMLYPIIHNHIHVEGDFEREHIDVSGYCKGRITLFVIIINGSKVYFDKEIKKVIKLFKEV